MAFWIGEQGQAHQQCQAYSGRCRQITGRGRWALWRQVFGRCGVVGPVPRRPQPAAVVIGGPSDVATVNIHDQWPGEARDFRGQWAEAFRAMTRLGRQIGDRCGISGLRSGGEAGGHQSGNSRSDTRMRERPAAAGFVRWVARGYRAQACKRLPGPWAHRGATERVGGIGDSDLGRPGCCRKKCWLHGPTGPTGGLAGPAAAGPHPGQLENPPRRSWSMRSDNRPKVSGQPCWSPCLRRPKGILKGVRRPCSLTGQEFQLWGRSVAAPWNAARRQAEMQVPAVRL